MSRILAAKTAGPRGIDIDIMCIDNAVSRIDQVSEEVEKEMLFQTLSCLRVSLLLVDPG